MAEDSEISRPRVLNRRRGGWWGVALRGALVLMVMAVTAGGVGAFALYVHFARDLPRLDAFDEMSASGVTRFEASDGALVGEWFQERRLAVTWGQLPERLVLAFLAAEDERFFEHSGIDLRGVARAMVENLRSGERREGASTITQQLAKTLVGNARSYERKVREAILARRMEDVYSKKQILTWYLNAIYLGHNSYGVQTAAQNYFRKNVWELSLAEMAMVAGLAQSPSRVNPVVNLPASRRRMAHVLKNMREHGWISPEEEQAALAEELVTYPLRDTLGDHVPYYTETVRKDVMARYATPDGSWLDRGLVVSMAVDPGAQRVAQEALGAALEDLARRQGYPGPLARLEREAFFARNAAHASPAAGERVLARVSEVGKSQATVEIAEGLSGTLKLADTKWAAPYTELPVKKGKRDTKASVSFGGTLKSMKDAFAVGDVVLVEVGAKKGREVPVELVPVPLMEGALLSLPVSGSGPDVMVGGWDFDRSQVNRAFAVRQTGSTMKPIIYSKAYDLGLPPGALFSGAPFRDGKYNPTGARSKDDMLVWDALAKSENSVSLRVLQYVLNHTTREDYQDWGRRLGLSRELTGFTSEVLGADQTPFGMARAFATLAHGGLAPATALVRKIVDKDGRVLERHVAPGDPDARFDDTLISLWESVLAPPERRIPATTAWITARNLTEVVARGTGTRAKKLGRDAAGKTGTLPYDVWFDGFTRDRVAVAWIGADRRERPLGKSEKVNKVYGGDTALPAWLAFMQAAEGDRPKRSVGGDPPADVVEVMVDPTTGLVVDAKGRTIPHRRGTEPTERALEPNDPANIGSLETEF
ncbi:MAG: hypothetical protein EP329_18565 [Deltaproteobacteria bacterium]|nr:MAG: hypothetical protein EP329_18565 [Deltaproteobacteria bacterium]